MIIDRQYLSERPARFFEEISAIPRVSLQEGQIADYLEDCPYILRPANYPGSNPGHGSVIVEVNGKRRGFLG